MTFLKKLGKFFLHLTIWVAIFIAVFFVTARLHIKNFEAEKTVAVGQNIPEMFPILIVLPPTSERPLSVKPIYYKDYSTALQNEKDFSFLIPAGMEEKINNLLKQQSRGYKRPMDFNVESENPWVARVTVEKTESGKQAIRFFETWDDDRINIGWYEANAKTFVPQKYLFYFGPATSTSSLLYALVLFFVVLLGKMLYKSFKGLRSNVTSRWRRNAKIFAVAVGSVLEVGLLYFYLTSVMF